MFCFAQKMASNQPNVGFNIRSCAKQKGGISIGFFSYLWGKIDMNFGMFHLSGLVMLS